MSYRPYREHWLRCNTCRTRRSTIQLLLAHRAQHPECKPCSCGGYHYSHTPGSPYCESNPRSAYRHALRRGESDEELLDILIEIALEGDAKPVAENACPPF